MLLQLFVAVSNSLDGNLVKTDVQVIICLHPKLALIKDDDCRVVHTGPICNA